MSDKKIKTVKTDQAPEAIGPYSQGIRAGDFLTISGQVPIDPKTNEVQLFGGDVARQTDLVLKNMVAIIKEAGAQLDQVIKTTIYLTNMEDFATVNEIYGTYFSQHKPARATVAVKALPKGVAIEIDAMVYLIREDQDG